MQEQNASKLILVVEDNAKHMTLITDVLELTGYRILKAINVEEAITILKIQDPDIVIADIFLPKFDGWELGIWIVKNKKDKKIPIIYLSALLREESSPIEGELGDYYMSKPFEAQRLIKKIEELLTPKKVA